MGVAIYCFLCVFNFLFEAKGIELKLSQDTVVVGDAANPESFILTCTVGSTQVDRVKSMVIYRKRDGDINWTAMVQISEENPNGPKREKTPADLERVIPGGEIVQSDSSPGQSFLTATIPISKLDCRFDDAQYRCSMSYVHSGDRGVPSRNSAARSLTLIYPPNEAQTITVRAQNAVSLKEQFNNGTVVNVGDVIKFTCSGDIGSDVNTQITWYRTPTAPGSSLIMVPYKYGKGNYVVTQTSVLPGCRNRRTTSAIYNIVRTEGVTIGFQCRINKQITVNNPPKSFMYNITSGVFYVQVAGAFQLSTRTPEPNSTVGVQPVTSTQEQSNTVMIALIVSGTIGIICAIVITTILIIRKRNSSGNDRPGNTRGGNTTVEEEAHYDEITEATVAPLVGRRERENSPAYTTLSPDTRVQPNRYDSLHKGNENVIVPRYYKSSDETRIKRVAGDSLLDSCENDENDDSSYVDVIEGKDVTSDVRTGI